MSKGMLSIFRKAQVAKAGAAPSDKLAIALLGPAARPAPPAPEPRPTLPARVDEPRARVVFAVDHTASREHTLPISIPLTDALLAALPGQLDVALATHGGGKVQIFTGFESDVNKLRDRAAGARCKVGPTRLLEILERVLRTEGVRTIVYIGDTFEESEKHARKLARLLAKRNIRLIILHDTTSYSAGGAGIFAEMARLTEGAVLPFDAAAISALRDMLAAVAVLAVGGTEMLEVKRDTIPAARLLLQYLKGDK